MSESNTGVVEPRVRWHDQETVTELLNGDIKIKSYFEDNLTVIRVGNTGLKVFLDQKKDSFVSVHTDFLPEDKVGPTTNIIKPSIIFGYALVKFYDWARNPENLSSLGLNVDNIQQVSSGTNIIMLNFMKNLFDKYRHNSLINEDVDGKVLVNWKGIIDLPETDPLIEYLRKMEKRGERTLVTYKKFA